ncbi:hypothetical protein NBRC111894_4282 [Sporolactobacillus inulinus]|uniref:Major facilitator superfamily (MFS) profile domain-containing protein n=2 Tax=Sporolactobacillus inulinus TaxID=2078 RepID=A0A4Y1ZJU8_9BACL|nr:hypothetical protein NBRC111894_4282 [Sporolactobacillus inulinus]
MELTGGRYPMVNKQTNPTWVLVLTSLGFFMAMMDSMIVTTASTAIRNDFGISVGELQWALNAYNITIAAVLLIGVSIGDRIGHRRLYNIGLFIFVLGSVFCALSSNIDLLIASRVIEGIGASVMTPMSMAILTASIPPSERGKALGIWSGIGGLALIVGPALGGLIVAKLAWQWIFWINVPIGLIGIYLSQRKLPETQLQDNQLNIIDSILIVLSSAGIIWALSESTSKMIQNSTLIVGVLSIVLGVVFVLRQRYEKRPMIPLSFFKSWTFSGGVISTFLLYASMYGVVFFLPQYLQVADKSNALIAGLQLLPWTGTLVIIAPIAGKAVDKFGERLVAITGLLLQGIGYLWIVLSSVPGNPYWLMIIPLIVAGAGISMAGPALQKAALGSVSRAEIAKASGIYNMFRLLGGAVGITVSVIIFYAFGDIVTTTAFTNGFSAAMIGSSVLSLLGILSSVGLRSTLVK